MECQYKNNDIKHEFDSDFHEVKPVVRPKYLNVIRESAEYCMSDAVAPSERAK